MLLVLVRARISVLLDGLQPSVLDWYRCQLLLLRDSTTFHIVMHLHEIPRMLKVVLCRLLKRRMLLSHRSGDQWKMGGQCLIGKACLQDSVVHLMDSRREVHFLPSNARVLIATPPARLSGRILAWNGSEVYHHLRVVQEALWECRTEHQWRNSSLAS